MNTIVEVSNLTKLFKGSAAVNHVNFRIPQGRIFGLLGPNGAGKTTIMRMLLGLIRPTEGNISIFGQDIATHREAVLQNIGSLIETPSYYGSLTARENMRIICLMKNVSVDCIDPILQQVNLQNTGSKKVSKFSLGMKQRLAIAQALVGNPRFIILDEPMNGLDPEGIYEMRNLIQSLSTQQQITFLISSHLLAEMEMISDELVIMKTGNIVYQGSLQDLLKNSANKFILEVDDLSGATSCLLAKQMQPLVKNQQLILHTSFSSEQLVSYLSSQNIQVLQILQSSPTLEEIYLHLIGSVHSDFSHTRPSS